MPRGENGAKSQLTTGENDTVRKVLDELEDVGPVPVRNDACSCQRYFVGIRECEQRRKLGLLGVGVFGRRAVRRIMGLELVVDACWQVSHCVVNELLAQLGQLILFVFIER